MEVFLAVSLDYKLCTDKYIEKESILEKGLFIDWDNMAIFRVHGAVEEYLIEDLFIFEGLIKSFMIRDWNNNLLSNRIVLC